ncbi:hypothetical protein ISN44_As02g004150 [Arabidopsis suecica]|uniref:Uncharacterized protein n=1 Tax=Arabidopsis suecica TaxID=45249 RepID=A0A8T2FX10_ARASU|nr:hypothetical protein ISN44_As02g004150 [Arabidopsis suecica]
MVLLVTPVAYATHILVGVGMAKKKSRLSLRSNRVWDPGGFLVEDATKTTYSFYSTMWALLFGEEGFDIGIRKRVKWTRGGWRLEVGINDGDHLELKTVKMKLKRNAANNLDPS